MAIAIHLTVTQQRIHLTSTCQLPFARHQHPLTNLLAAFPRMVLLGQYAWRQQWHLNR
ncbi:hypothetical protein D3C77_678610 [compost metagenome]